MVGQRGPSVQVHFPLVQAFAAVSKAVLSIVVIEHVVSSTTWSVAIVVMIKGVFAHFTKHVRIVIEGAAFDRLDWWRRRTWFCDRRVTARLNNPYHFEKVEHSVIKTNVF